MTTDSNPRTAAEARALAVELSREVAAVPGQPLRLGPIDLVSALEQVLFTTLRAPEAARPPAAPWWRARARGVAAAADAVRRRSPERPADVAVLLLAGVHRRLLAPVLDELERRAPSVRVGAVTAGRAARDPALAAIPTLAGALGPREALRVARAAHDTRAARRVLGDRARQLAASEHAALDASLGDTILRLRIEAARLDAALARLGPRAVATYDEIDAWSRLVVAVAERRDIVCVDLPHAEAVDVEAIRGVGYRLMGVYGPRAAAAVAAAGVDPARIRVVGAAAFDPLVVAPQVPLEDPPRVVMAAQYRNRLMTDEVRGGILDAAAAATAAIGASLQLCPHPVEAPEAWTDPAARAAAAHRVAVTVEPQGSLHRLLPGAALMVTGWSNSVFESVLAGVPALTVHLLAADPPMPFAAEGIAAEARDAADAARLAAELIGEPARGAGLARAREALAAHLGPLDGRAAERTADLLVEALD